MKFRRDDGIAKPIKAYDNDAGFDLYTPYGFILSANTFSDRIDLGVGFEIPKGFCGFITERSSQGKKGVHVIGPVVDSGYTGNVHVTLVNNSEEPYEVKQGDRICQMLVLAVNTEELEEVAILNGERGNNSHGSTGK